MRERLERALAQQAGGGSAAGRGVPPRPGATAAGGLRAALLRNDRRVRRPVELPPGRAVRNEAGEFWLRELRYPAATTRHGRFRLGDARQVDFGRIAEQAKDPELADARLEDCVFLDTETTGLSGGAGTTVFLTGLGWFEAGEFVLEQVFLRSFSEEPGALQHVAERLARRPRQLLVTFVGKAFDRHRLAARMTLHQVDSEVMSPRHLDLYYLARRRWRDVWPNVRLATVEQRALGLQRADDLPGSEAPAAFLGWLRDRCGPVDRVLEHNRIDVLSLAALLSLLGREAG